MSDLHDDENAPASNNRTFVYPIRFDKYFNSQFDIAHSKAYLECAQCYIQGEVDLTVEMNTSLFSSDFSVEAYVSGGIHGKFKIQGGIHGLTAGDKTSLFRLGFPPITVPGVFELNPAFAINAFVDVSANQEVSFSTQYQTFAKDFKVNLLRLGKARSKSVMEQEPTTSIDVLNPWDVFASHYDDINVSVKLAVGPTLELGYSMMANDPEMVRFFHFKFKDGYGYFKYYFRNSRSFQR